MTDCDDRGRFGTYLQVLSLLPGMGGRQAIFRPLQKKHASGGFFSARRLTGRGVKGIKGRGGRGDAER
jgi:hypothetical protein